VRAFRGDAACQRSLTHRSKSGPTQPPHSHRSPRPCHTVRPIPYKCCLLRSCPNHYCCRRSRGGGTCRTVYLNGYSRKPTACWLCADRTRRRCPLGSSGTKRSHCCTRTRRRPQTGSIRFRHTRTRSRCRCHLPREYLWTADAWGLGCGWSQELGSVSMYNIALSTCEQVLPRLLIAPGECTAVPTVAVRVAQFER
jgi:hypothetical protein